MKIVVAVLVALIAATIWWAVARNEVVVISSPCNTFVSEFAPIQTPVVTQIDGAWWLTVSYTPAPDKEASRVYSATLLGERTFEIAKTGRLFRARNANGHLQIKLRAKDGERELLTDLCYKT